MDLIMLQDYVCNKHYLQEGAAAYKQEKLDILSCYLYMTD